MLDGTCFYLILVIVLLDAFYNILGQCICRLKRTAMVGVLYALTQLLEVNYSMAPWILLYLRRLPLK